ncbi:MAG: restriction endonuclease subunit S [Oscillospiraceae bacterium]|nr:restriction endonuclease subunit S [Oscillospiraceae bacterium]
MARLGDLCTIVSGSTPKSNIPEYWDGDIKWITPAELTEDTYIINDSVRHITELGVAKTGLKPFPPGTVILSSKAPIGTTAIAGCEMYCNQGFKNLICSEHINPRYLYWFLTCNTEYLNSLGRGATFKEISKEIVSNIEIPLPPIETQVEISEKFEKISELIALRKEQLAKLDQLVKSRFIELFGDPVNNEMHWEKVPLSVCVESIDNGKSFVCDSVAREGEWPAILKLSAATYGFYRPEENKAVLDETQFVEDVAVRVGDLLFTRKNTPELVGMCAYVYDTPSNLMMPDLIFRLNTTERCNKIFLWKLINHDLFRGCIQAIATGSAKSMSNISKERLLNLEVILPPIKVQKQFAAFVEQTDKLKLTIQSSLDKLEVLKKSLMQEYFG